MFISVLCVFRVCLSILTDMFFNLIRLFPFQIAGLDRFHAGARAALVLGKFIYLPRPRLGNTAKIHTPQHTDYSLSCIIGRWKTLWGVKTGICARCHVQRGRRHRRS